MCWFSIKRKYWRFQDWSLDCKRSTALNYRAYKIKTKQKRKDFGKVGFSKKLDKAEITTKKENPFTKANKPPGEQKPTSPLFKNYEDPKKLEHKSPFEDDYTPAGPPQKIKPKERQQNFLRQKTWIRNTMKRFRKPQAGPEQIELKGLKSKDDKCPSTPEYKQKFLEKMDEIATAPGDNFITFFYFYNSFIKLDTRLKCKNISNCIYFILAFTPSGGRKMTTNPFLPGYIAPAEDSPTTNDVTAGI